MANFIRKFSLIKATFILPMCIIYINISGYFRLFFIIVEVGDIDVHRFRWVIHVNFVIAQALNFDSNYQSINQMDISCVHLLLE